MPEVEGGVVQEPAHREEAKSGFITRQRILLLAGVFVLELVVFFAATVIPLSPAKAEGLRQLANSTFPHGAPPLQTAADIFSHNLLVALMDMIPVVGAFVFLYSIFTTGQVLQAFALHYGIPAPLLGALLFVFPYTIVELSAYVLAVVSGSMLVVAWRRKRLRTETEVLVIEIVGVASMLLLAASMETMTELSPGLSLMLWLPLGLLIAWLAVALSRGLKQESPPPPPSPLGTPPVTGNGIKTLSDEIHGRLPPDEKSP
jgi:hypothetical protein